jgi:broad specificity phosphatase PhoE
MTTRVLLVSHGATEATRRAAFPADEPLLEIPALAAERADVAVCGPALRCRQTAAALGVDVTVEPRLRDCDYGRWAGLTLAELPAEDVEEWLTDPASAPHGGESIVDLLGRVGGWLDSLGAGRIVAVTHPAVVKAAVVHAIRASAESFWRIDVVPLSKTLLSGNPGQWRLRVSDFLS